MLITFLQEVMSTAGGSKTTSMAPKSNQNVTRSERSQKYFQPEWAEKYKPGTENDILI